MTKEQVIVKLQSIQAANLGSKETSITTYCNGDVITFSEYPKERHVTFSFYDKKDAECSDEVQQAKLNQIIGWMNEYDHPDIIG